MVAKKQKLELTWIGKGEDPVLEPRILIEDPTKSYGDPKSENMLIHGDNLLALKALEQDYTNRIKCIYIDPPYNTGNAFEYYDDNLEHSIWLNLMYARLLILKKLLNSDGCILIQLDDTEVHYCKTVMDDIFGRNNFICSIAVKSSTPSGLKTAHKNKTIIKQKDFILLYKGNGNLKVKPQYTKKEKWDGHYSFYYDPDKRVSFNLKDLLVKNGFLKVGQKLEDLDIYDKEFKKFYLKHQNHIYREQPTIPDSAKTKSLETPNEIIKYPVKDGKFNYALNGRRLGFLNNSIRKLEDGSEDIGILLCDFWSDIDFQNTQNEGGVKFPSSKKPEKLIFRILKLFTEKNDVVLDSFLGSGTTAAVAHKMKRKYIGIELGDHAYTHSLKRLIKVVDGKDLNGVTKLVNWKGGGGFKFYELAPSLLNKDEHGNWIISKEYNADMLAAAVAKNNGFKYSPDQNFYWKQGQSSEKDFIFTTTNFVTVEFLDKIHDEIQPGESLLICCKAFQESCENRFSNITIKKIPLMLLGKCEFGKEDYSLNIINVPTEDNKDIKENDENKLNNEKKETEVSQLNLLDK